ncbi:MAG: hypothetical protein Q7S40_05890 [Opitutaceae bacterium]|nr:hypothetical protein [Opitutaceae bacterium]
MPGPGDGHRYSTNRDHALCMQERIDELETQLVAANASIATLTATNVELTRSLSDAESLAKRMKRSARRDESSLKDQLNAAQNRR